jgi:hypothetical protein
MDIINLQEMLDNVNAVGAHNTLHAGHMMGLRLIPGSGKASANGRAWMSGFRADGGIVWLGHDGSAREYIMEVEHDGPDSFDLMEAVRDHHPDVVIGSLVGYLMGLVANKTISANELKKLAFRIEQGALQLGG